MFTSISAFASVPSVQGIPAFLELLHAGIIDFAWLPVTAGVPAPVVVTDIAWVSADPGFPTLVDVLTIRMKKFWLKSCCYVTDQTKFEYNLSPAF